MTGDELCKTGINEMDKILGGGIPQGSSVLLAGSSGSGKTILCSEFIFKGASEHDEKGVYICLTEPKARKYRERKRRLFRRLFSINNFRKHPYILINDFKCSCSSPLS